MIKDEIREIRLFLGLSQADLAQRTGLKPAAISHYETGEREPSMENLVKLCKGLGVSPDRLLKWKEKRTKTARYSKY